MRISDWSSDVCSSGTSPEPFWDDIVMIGVGIQIGTRRIGPGGCRVVMNTGGNRTGGQWLSVLHGAGACFFWFVSDGSKAAGGALQIPRFFFHRSRYRSANLMAALSDDSGSLTNYRGAVMKYQKTYPIPSEGGLSKPADWMYVGNVPKWEPDWSTLRFSALMKVIRLSSSM